MSAPESGNVVLVGFMGSGKSSVGRMIARTLRRRFVDTDKLVVTRTGRQITEIFAEQGETAFRQLESEALNSLSGQKGLVIATGGGIVTIPANVPVLKELGLVVWLTADEQVIWDRVSRNSSRPLLHTEDPRRTVHELLEKRNPLYEAVAHMTLDTTLLTHEEAAEKVCGRALRPVP